MVLWIDERRKNRPARVKLRNRRIEDPGPLPFKLCVGSNLPHNFRYADCLLPGNQGWHQPQRHSCGVRGATPEKLVDSSPVTGHERCQRSGKQEYTVVVPEQPRSDGHHRRNEQSAQPTVISVAPGQGQPRRVGQHLVVVVIARRDDEREYRSHDTNPSGLGSPRTQ